MKLIDKELLCLNCALVIDEKKSDLKNWQAVDEQVHKAPTVEAIPIEWLEKKMNDCKNKIGKAIYEKIIDDWREEKD